jgi:OmcA/MtrC family decaheme c-type cytochrome
MTIEKVDIPADLRPVVTFTAVDDRGDTLALNEFADVRFIMGFLKSYVNGGSLKYSSYITRTDAGAVQGTTDSARLSGLTQNKNGKFKYKFATALPANYDASASHQVASQSVREFAANETEYIDNPWFAWVPNGSSPLQTREIVDTETCNTCHTRLEFHGGERREIQYCIMCHTPQSTDGQSLNTVDMAEMIHKIHRGEDLPSVEDGEPYQIVGFGNSVHDYSDVVFPQDIRNCEVCHGEEKALFYLENPSMSGCGSCHDRTWFGDPDLTPVGYTDHGYDEGTDTQLVNLTLTDDSLCATCHMPTSGVEPIVAAHITPLESDDAPGLQFDIASVEILNPGATAQLKVNFTVADKNGAPYTNLNTELTSCNALLAWPTTDYEQYINASVRNSANLVNNGGGSYSYTYVETFDSSTTDTFGIAMTGRLSFAHEGSNVTQGPSANGLIYFRMDGGEPEPRRDVVDEEACNTCHGDIKAHGEQRFGVGVCLMCHNPLETDEVRRPAGAMPPVTVNFKDMLHKIHTGEDLEGAATIYGYGNIAHDFTEVRFPAKREECMTCHAEETFQLPTPDGTSNTIVIQELNGPTLISDTLPGTAACTTCHDGLAPLIHAFINTAQGVETCIVCHGEGSDYAVSEVHALEP